MWGLWAQNSKNRNGSLEKDFLMIFFFFKQFVWNKSPKVGIDLWAEKNRIGSLGKAICLYTFTAG